MMAGTETAGCGFLTSTEIEQAIEDRLDAERSEAFERHVDEGCTECAMLAADLETFRAVVEGGPLETERRESDRQAEMLRARLRREAGKQRLSQRPRRAFAGWGWAIAAASVMVAAMGLWLVIGPGGGDTIRLPGGGIVELTPKPYSAPVTLRGEAGLERLWRDAGRAYEEGRFAEAARLFGEIEGRAPRQVDAPLYRGVSLLLDGRTAEAHEALARARSIAVEEDLPAASILWYQALALLRDGDAAGARPLLEQARAAGGPYGELASELLSRFE